LWGALTGNLTLALSVSIIFELFWLDLVPAGTFIPPNIAASNLAALSLIHFFGFQKPGEIIFPVLLCLPLAWLGSRLEHFQRNRQNAGYNLVLSWTQKSRFKEFAPRKLILRGILQSAVLNMIFFCGSVLCLITLTGVLQSHGLVSPPVDFFSWGHLWLVASLGGILSLRTPRAYFILACGVGLVAVVSIF